MTATPSSDYVQAATSLLVEQKPVLFITNTNERYPEDPITARATGANGRPSRFDGWEITEKRLRVGYHRLSQILYGKNYWRSGKEGVCFGGSLEPQKDGAPHAHSVCWAPGRDLLETFTDRKTVSRGNMVRTVIPSIEEIFREAGFGKIVSAEIIRNPEKTSWYCCKYSIKHGGLIVGGHWKHAPSTPPPLVP